ncbi:SixA phosphatase family protein [Lutimaribacter marinistellae]|uniref:SixA phosphatase family protein n=1 Tax=Lutimaribacter marinistellae TaxID=1820329 RepID=A0ABV7TG55_9RHOB
MTRTLILTRHAKSSWDNPDLADFDRPLNKRGRKSAPLVGAWLTEHGWTPDTLLCSTSERTRETWSLMGLEAYNTDFRDALYHAGPDRMMQVLRESRGETVLLLGHNPGMAEFAGRIVDEAPDHPRFYDYPTCATTVIRFEVDTWRDLRWESGEVLGFVVPRELPEMDEKAS